MLVSGVQQSDSVIDTCVSILVSSRSLLVVHFRYSSEYMSIPPLLKGRSQPALPTKGWRVNTLGVPLLADRWLER